MTGALIKEAIEENYGIKVDSVTKIKNIFKINSNNKIYCFKIIKYEYSHFIFIISAMLHLQNNGFTKIPEFIKTLKNKYYIKVDNCYCYLTEWILGHQCNYTNPIELKMTVLKLAELHTKSKNFKITSAMKPRIGWLRWIKTFETRENEILDFKNKIENKEYKSDFDLLYLNMMENELKRADKAIQNLKISDYMSKMKKEILNRSFCHHDMANHNVIINNNIETCIIDFDYCILDTHLHDLSSVLIRSMKNGAWSMEKALFILDYYNSENTVYTDDIPIMAAFIEFPQAYWQLGIQYYWENQPWSEEFFINKLNKIYCDNDLKQEFVGEFRSYQYASII